MRQVGYKADVKTADTGRLWTKGLWGNCPWDQIQAGERNGTTWFDDFINMPAMGEADAADTLYATYGDGGTTIQQGAANEWGELAIVLDTTDNDEAWVTTGGNTGGLAKFILQATAVPHRIWFEARYKKSSITTGGVFVGFAEEALAAADTVVDGGTLADKDYFLFATLEADPDSPDIVYNKEGGANPTTALAGADTWVADTYVKHGLSYDYMGPASQQISYWIDGVLQTTYTTKTNIDDATNFPGGEEMALIFGGKNSTGATNTFTMDWWRFAMLDLS